ncbi:MAG: ATP-binding protein [Eggerthellaceae bacterium]
MEIRRDIYLNRIIDRMHNGMVKVVTGIRRCGKTYLLFNLFGDYLRRDLKVSDDCIIEIALDSEDNAKLRDPSVLNEFIKSRIIDKTAQYYILLDEVQYAISKEEAESGEPPRLYGVLNGLLHLRNVDVYVTGSNSKLLSSDVMTQFRGRGDEIRVRPLSFAEFIQGFEGDKYEAWAEYVVYGGMPLILSMRTDEQKSRYLERLFSETYLKDVISRNDISKTQELEDLVDVLASSIGSLTNPPKIEATFASVLKSKISTNTISAYIGYLEESFLIEEARRYDIKGRKYIGSPKKYYFEDIGLRNARLNFRQVEETHIMENILFNELRMRGFSVDVGSIKKKSGESGKTVRKQLEVDFVANLGSRRYYIQSALHLPGIEKEQQEKASLLAVPDSFKKVVLVKDTVKPLYDEHGILTMSVFDFLLDENSLNNF